MMAMVLFGLLGWGMPLLIGLAALIWAIVVMVRSLTIPSNLRGQALCGVCSYPVGTLAIERCPECGTRYTTAGVRTPRTAARDRGSTAGAIVAWSMLMGVAAMIAVVVFAIMYSMVIEFGTQRVQGVAQYLPIAQEGDASSIRVGPDYALEFVVDLEWDWSIGTNAAGSIGVTLLVDDEPAGSLLFDTETGDEPTETDALEMFRDAGFDIDDEVIGHEARQVITLLDAWKSDISQQYYFYQSTGGPIQADLATQPALRDDTDTAIAGWGEVSYVSSAPFGPMASPPPPVWYTISAVGTGAGLLALWAVVVWLIARRRRSMLRTLDTPVGIPAAAHPPGMPANTVTPAAESPTTTPPPPATDQAPPRSDPQ